MISVGELTLDAAQARHARSVLRLTDGAEVEVFDDAGRVVRGVLLVRGEHTSVRVDAVDGATPDASPGWCVAAAVPKGDRADWMVEKLSEMGAAAFVPLAAARSVVLPEGRGKRDWWVRIATESAKQSRRRGVMRIEELTPLAVMLRRIDVGGRPGRVRPRGWFLSTAPDALPVRRAVAQLDAAGGTGGTGVGAGEPLFTLFIGPEGGWTPDEAAALAAAGLTGVGLTGTILRVETAAVAAAAIVATMMVTPAGEGTGPGAGAAGDAAAPGGDAPADVSTDPHP